MPDHPSSSEFAAMDLMPSPSTIYADQLAQLAMGPFVTKMVFGTGERAGTLPTPVQTIIMPTGAVLAMAQQILSGLTNEHARAVMVAEIEKLAEGLRTLKLQ